MKTVIEVYTTRLNLLLRKEWRWRMFSAENGNIIGQSSEGYYNQIDMRSNLQRVTGYTLALSDPGRYTVPPRVELTPVTREGEGA